MRDGLTRQRERKKPQRRRKMNNNEQSRGDAPPPKPQGPPPPKEDHPPNIGYQIGGYPQPGYGQGYIPDGSEQSSGAPQQKQQTGWLEGCLSVLCCCCLWDACF